MIEKEMSTPLFHPSRLMLNNNYTFTSFFLKEPI
jgi:hypothetical protein